MNVNWKVLTILILIVLIGVGVYTCRSQSFKVEEVRQFGQGGASIVVLR